MHPVLLITCHLSYESTVLKVFKSCVHSLTPCLSHWEVNCGQSSVASARTGQKDLQHCLSDICMMDTQNTSSDQQGLAALHPPCSTFASRSKPHCLAIIPNHSPVQLWMFHYVSYVLIRFVGFLHAFTLINWWSAQTPTTLNRQSKKVAMSAANLVNHVEMSTGQGHTVTRMDQAGNV